MQTEVRSSTRLPAHKPTKPGIYRRYVKRPMDFILSLCALVVLWPVLLAVAVLVRVKLGSPVIFKQKRPGLNEKIFALYKFRTMTDTRDQNGELLPDEMRLTRFGRFLRSTSLDELPELFNVLKGDMSVVGPRPLAAQYLPYYSEHERRRHSVRPGLTGLAQVSGRNSLGWEDRFAYDVEYCDKVSFALDTMIVCRTILQVLRCTDIGVRGVDAPEDFDAYRMRQREERVQEGRVHEYPRREDSVEGNRAI